MTIRFLLAVALSLTAAGCQVEADDDDDSTPVTDDDDDSTPHEEGCITVDGQTPGFANIADALAEAPDGATVSLCDGTWTETVTLDRPVHLKGRGTGTTFLEGAVNEVALIIRGTGVTVEGLAISSTRTAVELEAGAEATLLDVLIDQPGQVGILSTSAQVALTRVTISNAPYGGADFSVASTATVSDCTFSGNAGYGIHVGSSGLTLTNTLIENTASIVTDDGTDGGDAISIETGMDTISLDGLEAVNNARVAILSDTAALSLTNSRVEASTYGVFAFSGGASVVSDSSFTAMSYVGLNFIDQQVDVLRNTVALSPETSVVGIALGKDGIQAEVSGNTVTGSGLTGIRIQSPINGSEFAYFEGGSVVMTDNQVSDSKLFGIYATSLESLDYQRNVVRNITWLGELEDSSYTTGFGHLLSDIDDGEGSLHMVGNEAHGVDVVGMFIAASRFTSEGAIIEGNRFLGVLYQDSAGTESGADFHDNKIYAAQVQTSSVEFSACTWQTTDYGVPPELWGSEEQYQYSGTGLIIFEGTARVTDSFFSANNGTGLQAYDGDVTVAGSQFNDNTGAGAYTSGYAADGFPIHFEDCAFSNNGSYHVSASYTDAEFKNCTFEGATGFVSLYGYDYSGTVEGCSFAGGNVYHLYLSGGGSTVLSPQVLGSSFADATSYSIYGYRTAATIADTEFAGNGVGVNLDLSQLDENSALAVANNDFATTAGGLSVNVSSVVGAGPSMQISGNTFTGQSGYPVRVSASGGKLDLLDNIVTDCSTDALWLSNPSGSTVSVIASGNQVEGASGSALVLSNAAVDVSDNVSLSGNGADGIRLEGTILGNVANNVLHDNQGYGIGCYASTVTLSSCVNESSGNVSGDVGLFNGCAIDCTSL